MRLLPISVAVSIAAATLLAAMPASSQSAEPGASQVPRHGALAVDRDKGFVFGWAYDHPSRAEAGAFALEECSKRNGSCKLVVEFAGEGCASYHTIAADDGSAYGWGTSATREGAQSRSLQECNAFAGGKAVCSNHVWACNSNDGGPFKVLHEEPVKPKAAKTDCLVQFEIDEETNGGNDWVNRYRTPVYRLTASDCPSAPNERYHSYQYFVRDGVAQDSEYKQVSKDPKIYARGVSLARDFYGWFSKKPAPGGNTHFRPFADVYVTAVTDSILADLEGGVAQSDSDRRHGICLAYLPPGVVPVSTHGAERCKRWVR